MSRFSIIIIVLLTIALFSIGNSLHAQQLVLKPYNRSSGLVSDYVMCMLQDRDGFIWFGTDKGLCKYDGSTFSTYTSRNGLTDNFIISLLQDRDGFIWAGTFDGGTVRFDGTTFQSISPPREFIGIRPMAVAQDTFGRIYFISKKGFACFYHDTFYPDTTLKSVSSIKKDHDGTYILCSGGLLYRLTPSNDSLLHIRPIQLPVTGSGTTLMVLEEPMSQKFGAEYCLGTMQSVNFLSRLTDSTFALTRSIHLDYINSLAAEGDSILWCGTVSKGLLKITPDTMTSYTASQGIDQPRIETLMRDVEGNLWISTFGSGVQKLMSSAVRLYKEEDGLPGNYTYDIFEDSRNRMWFGTVNGVGVLDHEILTHVLPREKAMTEIRTITEDRFGRYYFGSYENLIGPESFEDLQRGVPPRVRRVGSGASSIYPDQFHSRDSESIWTSSYGNGISYLHGNHIEQFTINDGVASDIIEEIVPGYASLWLLSRNAGLTQLRNGAFTIFSITTGLPSNAVYSLYEEPFRNDSGTTVWIGTDAGLTKLSHGSITTYSEKDGIIGTPVIKIVPIDTGDERTEHSMYIVTPRAIQRYQNGKIELVASLSFLSSQHPEINAAYVSPKTQTLWLATSNGVYSTNISNLQEHPLPPRVSIVDYSADTSLVVPSFAGNNPHNRLPSAILAYRNNTLRIRYAGLSFTSEEDIQFLVKLDPIDKNWSQTMDRHVEYRNLNNGEYTFRVVAINKKGERSLQEATLTFYVQPPFWKRWWFILLTGIAGFCIIVITVRYVVQRKLKIQAEKFERQQALQRERDRISRDLHDNVGAQLVNIISGLELVGRYAGDRQDETKSVLESLKDDARVTMTLLRETIWALSSSGMAVEKFTRELEQTIRKQLKYHPTVQLQFTVEGDTSLTLRPVDAINLLRIAQEALSNCLKHASPSLIDVRLRIDGQAVLHLSVWNNGCLQEPNEDISGGKGIPNMERRAREVGGDFQFIQHDQETASVEVSIPIHSKENQ